MLPMPGADSIRSGPHAVMIVHGTHGDILSDTVHITVQ